MIDNKVKKCQIYCAGYDFLIKGRFWRGGSIYMYIYIYIRHSLLRASKYDIHICTHVSTCCCYVVATELTRPLSKGLGLGSRENFWIEMEISYVPDSCNYFL